MAARDPGLERFGADTHRYELAPRLSEAEIRAFEESHGSICRWSTGLSSRRWATAPLDPATG